MKTAKQLLITSLICLAASGLMAQTADTNAAPKSIAASLGDIAKAITSTKDWHLVGGYGHSVGGADGTSLWFVGAAGDFNDNLGGYLGVDTLKNGTGSTFNDVKGGLTLKTTIQPFAFLGSTSLTNVTGQPYVGVMLSTAHGGNAVGEINVAGINFEVWSFKNFVLEAGAGYEQRNGQGAFDGNYALIHAGISRKF